MRALLARKAQAARGAVDLFVYRVAREAEVLVSSLGDGIVFTVGIGEHASESRAAICELLHWLGARLDTAANAARDVRVSATDSPVTVLVLPADEEVVIARQTLATAGLLDESNGDLVNPAPFPGPASFPAL
jgi:acetate kinase